MFLHQFGFNGCVDWCFPDGAEIVSITTELLVGEDGTALLECVVTANPIDVDGLVTWSRSGGYDMTRTLVEYVSGVSRLTIPNVVKGDSGVFTCTASNGLGVPATANADLLVKCNLYFF